MTDAALDLLRRARIDIVGRLADASNATFLCRLGNEARAVYKPIRGERPLDDFPLRTLANREVAAYLLSEATGWSIVPPTVMRDGPYGRGMVQLWVEPAPDVDVVALIVGADPRLRRICIFDVLANNADRKGGHLLVMSDGHIHGVDHGICFNVEPKLRTVLWAWRGEPLAPDELAVVRRVCDGLDGPLAAELGKLLSGQEVAAIQSRAVELLRTGVFPEPDPSRPALPWPPF